MKKKEDLKPSGLQRIVELTYIAGNAKINLKQPVINVTVVDVKSIALLTDASKLRHGGNVSEKQICQTKKRMKSTNLKFLPIFSQLMERPCFVWTKTPSYATFLQMRQIAYGQIRVRTVYQIQLFQDFQALKCKLAAACSYITY